MFIHEYYFHKHRILLSVKHVAMCAPSRACPTRQHCTDMLALFHAKLTRTGGNTFVITSDSNKIFQPCLVSTGSEISPSSVHQLHINNILKRQFFTETSPRSEILNSGPNCDTVHSGTNWKILNKLSICHVTH